MKVLYLPTHESGVSYYRHHLPFVGLKGKVEVVAYEQALVPWAVGPLKENKDLFDWVDSQCQGVDVIHAGWSNNVDHLEVLAALREKYKIPFIIDYDDDILNVSQSNLNYRHYHEGSFSRRVARMGLRIADSVTLSTFPLVESLSVHCRFTDLLPNYTHPPHWSSTPLDPSRKDDKSVRIMFAGGLSHLGDINLARQALEWAIRYYDGKEGRPHVKVIFLACMPDWAVPYISSPTSPTSNSIFYIHSNPDVRLWQKVIRWISPDILIAPLEHNKFNESKSLIKCYDAAMVEGCAFACEELSTYQDIPQNACVNVNSNGQGSPWQIALKELIEDRDMRRGMSKLLRKWVLDCRTIDDNIYKWEAAYKAALSRPIVKDLSDIVRPRIYGPDGNLAND